MLQTRLVVAALSLAAGVCAAQPAATVPPPPILVQPVERDAARAPAASSQAAEPARRRSAQPAAAAASATAAEPASRPHLHVIEDDNVRIEELRVRGQTQRITVQSKVGNVKAYEILVAPGGRDASQDRGATGQRAWSLFDF